MNPIRQILFAGLALVACIATAATAATPEARWTAAAEAIDAEVRADRLDRVGELARLRAAYDAIWSGSGSTPDRARHDALLRIASISRARGDLQSLVDSARALETVDQGGAPARRQNVLAVLVHARAFELVEAYAATVDGSWVVPRAVRLEPRVEGPSVFEIEDGGMTLRERALPLVGDVVLAVGSPACAFSRDAVDALASDRRLREAFSGKLRWITPQEYRHDFAPIAAWNRAYPGFAMAAVVDDTALPFDAGRTPQFVFLRDGRVVEHVTGWPDAKQADALLQALRRFERDTSAR